MSDTSMRDLFDQAKDGNHEAIGAFLDIFKPILYKSSIVNGYFNEDHFQELSIKLIYCIKTFQFINVPDVTEYFH
ncbi:helix-turn-helix domain-containing protein [Geosporobacter ferrireducens]|nr:helix-turn-helix domain-containing protein [Geosporobacter ferrireducens]MTI53655.1 helix-turn-helix domain-containing protein [Geosporobacter ferrireducens]